jgi:uncharacterized protein
VRTFLDTNIFLYAAGGAHSQKEACARVLQRVADGTLEATVNSDVLQEILYVLSRRGKLNEAIRLIGYISDLFPDLLTVGKEDVLEACKLLRQAPNLSVRDAIHAATMKRNGLKRIISVDPDFDRIHGIRRLEPE